MTFVHRAASIVVGIAAAILLALVIITPLEARNQALFGGTLFVLALLLNRFSGRFATLAMIVVSITVSTRYLYWRLTSTVAFEWTVDTLLASILLFAEIYAYIRLLLGYFQTLEPMRRKPVPLPRDPAHWPTIDVFIPTYNEPLSVVRATVLAARQMDWPSEKLQVYILDDGARPEFRAFAARAGVQYLIRPDNKHAKAGNINHALSKTHGEHVAIFDCDHIPTRGFLQATVGMLVADPNLAMVQTPHHFYSPDPFERNLDAFRTVPNEGELFYGLIQPGNDLWNAVFFCGSCAVIRRSALESIGGVAVETVTEDAHTMLRLHRNGWSSAFLDIILAAGLATGSLAAHIGQRIRWARGMAQIFRVDNPLFGRGLSLAQRLCYVSAMTHFFFGIPRIIFLLAPLGYLFFEAQIFNAAPILVLTYSLPHLAHSLLTTSRTQKSYRHSFWSDVYEVSLAPYVVIPTTLALIAPGFGHFNVTAKDSLIDRRFFAGRIVSPLIVLWALNLVGLGVAVWRLYTGNGSGDVVFINLVWIVYNLLILGTTVAVAWEKRQLRSEPRVNVRLPAMLRLGMGTTVRAQLRDVSLTGACLVVKEPLEKGTPVLLSILSGREERPLPSSVVEHRGNLLRVKFDELNLQEQSWLVGAVFGRADAWVTWGQQYKKDFALGTFLELIRHTVRVIVLPFVREKVPVKQV